MKQFMTFFSGLRYAVLAVSTVFGAALPLAHGASKVLINGAGATFPAPIYSKWFQDYNKLDANVEINYQSIGSGGGIKQLTEKTVDFGASDAPMSDGEITAAGGGILHVPTVLGAVTITYNVPGLEKAIRLDGKTLAEIFSGKITNWSDPKIAAFNPGFKFPSQPIVVVYRSDSSGTTAVFTEFLSKVSPEWEKLAGHGKTVKWPVGLGGKGNEGVGGLIKNTAGALGYVELTYAVALKLPTVEMKNKAGNFVAPTTDSVSNAAAGAKMPPDFRVSITNPDGKDAYPISAFTYLLVRKSMPGDKGVAFVKFLNWALDGGQKEVAALSYAPLPAALVAKVKSQVSKITTK
jgi:phosphate transport system substrate-binding protein